MGRFDARRARDLERSLAGLVTPVAIGLLCIGLGVYGAIDSGESSSWVFLAVFLPLGVLFLGAAAIVVWRRRPRPAEGVDVVATAETRRGGRVEASVRLERTSPWPLRAGLVCRELYDVDQMARDPDGDARVEVVTREGVAHADWRDLDSGALAHDLVFPVPADSPYSHDGVAMKWIWEVVVEQRDGAGGRPRTATAAVQVAP